MSTDAKGERPRIVLASGNAGKLNEFRTLLQGFDILPQSDFDLDSAEETGLSFVENAILKARHACQFTGLPAIADDSGLEVDALQGQPGIHSARFAGVDGAGKDAANNAKLLNSLAGLSQEERGARFQCVLVYMRHAEDPTPLVCQASWEGKILHQPSGEGGFGYDPLFYVEQHQCSAAELSKEQKNAISHRGKAMDLLLARLQQQGILAP
ncbi:RdgB/HAM1 family non-canonical purine NTP pyrophosphatase [Pseudomaricurvus alkylphenolicus]|jgi:XTP/dITP diphosphohydrolase|uniref:RdgB/HAM1 family non-canonical purine NTP pyrophosphatase n=1 Tax=Pseudomaricurvus alkylphenolicus TaxID=1306991 RepID=UPI001421EBF7|nr:RdgB/HAM1 family non-canonical purine NTP pyrophosphatase [Pseudomaricurvus alkylphenolicus]NIB39390.1 RdgB/HAM1 family non-canonical purine NTP pyrophosphatase [Pseudomaricurvus alkylphenolicus]